MKFCGNFFFLFLPLALIAGSHSAMAAGASVILISVDTLRADHLGIYGYKGNPTSHIDSFANHGTVFTQVDSQVPLTLPSHTSLFTSTYPFQNHVEENGEIVPPALVTLASVLRRNGYETGAFIGSTLLSRRCGLDKGFDTYDSPFHSQNGPTIGPYSVRVRRDGALVTRSALDWLAGKQGRPVFAFVHLFDLHTPYAVRNFSGNRLIPNPSGYDAEIRYIDQVLGHFKDRLVQTGWWQKSVVILLADHGESLGDHGETSHGYFAYESTLHVPLIIHWPASAENYPQRVNEPAGLTDVAPTLLGFLHIRAPASFVGTNLLNGAVHPRRPIYSETTYAHDAFHWAALRRVRMRNLVYIDAPRPELYNLDSDPAERNNILRMHPEEARNLKQQLTLLLAHYSNGQPNVSADMSATSTAALRSLGYLAGGSEQADGRAGPDPKDKLTEYQAYEKALTALYTNQALLAATRFRDLLAKDPVNTLARYYLGETDVKLGHAGDALREWRAAIEHDHTYAPAAIAIGDLYLLQGLPEKARDAFEEAIMLSADDYEAQLKLGTADERLGLLQDAKRHIEAGCRLAQSDDSDCQRALEQLKQKSQ